MPLPCSCFFLLLVALLGRSWWHHSHALVVVLSASWAGSVVARSAWGRSRFPAIHALTESVRTALGITTPVTVYLLDTSKLPNPTPPIAVLGVTKPYVIMLSVTLLEQTGSG